MRPPFLLASLILAAAPFAHCPPNTGGAGATTTAPTCEPAANNAPACLWGACDGDADCGASNYCEPCASGDGCAAGHCRPTRVQGVPCDRPGMCATACCADGRDVGHAGERVCMPATYCGGDAGVNLRDGGAGP